MDPWPFPGWKVRMRNQPRPTCLVIWMHQPTRFSRPYPRDFPGKRSMSQDIGKESPSRSLAPPLSSPPSSYGMASPFYLVAVSSSTTSISPLLAILHSMRSTESPLVKLVQTGDQMIIILKKCSRKQAIMCGDQWLSSQMINRMATFMA